MPITKVDIKELLKAGAHFGHKSSHWNPQMRPYIHSQRDGIYIINLLKTTEQLTRAAEFAQALAAEGKQVLFVGTKRHIREAVKEAAQVANMPYVSERWFGGILTNFATISKRVKQLKDTEAKFESGELAETYNKRELLEIQNNMAKMNKDFGGIKDMEELPAAVFVADVVTDFIAVKEATRLGIPVIGLVDTNGDPTGIEYVIAANDDAVSTVKLISDYLAQAIKTAKPAKKSAEVKK